MTREQDRRREDLERARPLVDVGVADLDLDPGEPGDDDAGRDQDREHGADRDDERPLALLERLELLAGALVADLRLRDAAGLGLGGEVGHGGLAAPRTRRLDRASSSVRSPPARGRRGGAAVLALAAVGALAVAAAHDDAPTGLDSTAAAEPGAPRPRDRRASRIALTTTMRVGPGGDDLGDVAGVDPADREPGQLGLGGGGADVVEAGRRPARLRRRRPDRADADVVGAVLAGGCVGGAELLRGVGREADDGVGAGDAPGLGDGDVVLADVDAVGRAGGDEVGAVVDQEEGVVAVGGWRGRPGRRPAARRRRRPCRAAGSGRRRRGAPRRAGVRWPRARRRPRRRDRGGIGCDGPRVIVNGRGTAGSAR